MVTSEIIEAAELRLVRKPGLHLPSLAAQFSRAEVQREAWESFARKQLETLRRHVGELDPRVEPSIATMMLHCYLTGVMSAREEMGR